MADPIQIHDPVRQPGPMAAGGRRTPVEQGLFARVKAGISRLFSGDAPKGAPSDRIDDLTGMPRSGTTIAPPAMASDVRRTSNLGVWMGPGDPIHPVVVNPGDVAGRAYDFPVGVNISTTPRRFEGISFESLEQLAGACDLVSTAIATRQDQMSNLTFSPMLRKRAGETYRAKPDDRCRQIEEFFRKPDRRTPLRIWIMQLVHEQLVYDAPAVYARKTIGGEPYSLEIVKGSTIVPKVDKTGRMPMPPDVAFQQILKGVPAADYMATELFYFPRNPRPGHLYGYSPLEQIIMTVNIALRRDVAKLSYFTEGNIPEALISVPQEWTPEQISRFQTMWDAIMADQATRRRVRFVPGGFSYQPTRTENSLMDAVDEWLARVVAFAFSLPPTPFVKMMNRATSESAYEAALTEGLQPMMGWLKDFLDDVIANFFGWPDIEATWDKVEDADPLEEDALSLQKIKAGMISIDEWRSTRGLDPIGLPAIVYGVGPLGFMSVQDMAKAIQQGMTIPQPAPPPDMGMGAPGAPGAAPPQFGGAALPPPPISPLQAALTGVPQHILDAVGAGPGGAGTRRIDVTAADAHASDPLSNVAYHPKVIEALREAEASQGRNRRAG